MADILTVTELVRSALGAAGGAPADLDEAVALHADDACQAVVRACARNDGLRRHVLTDPASVTLSLAAGAGDLSALVASPRVLLDLFHLGVVTHAGHTFPLRHVGTPGQGALPGALDALFARYWIVGTDLYTRGLGGETLAGPLALAVPYWMTLAQLPDALVGLPGVGLAARLVEMLSAARAADGKRAEGKRAEGKT